jgi:hypothetical protein
LIHVRRDALPELRRLRLPGVNLHVPLPDREQIPWIVGLLAAAAVELIDWPVAIVIAVGHTVAAQSRNESIRELAEGIEAGA